MDTGGGVSHDRRELGQSVSRASSHDPPVRAAADAGGGGGDGGQCQCIGDAECRSAVAVMPSPAQSRLAALWSPLALLLRNKQTTQL